MENIIFISSKQLLNILEWCPYTTGFIIFIVNKVFNTEFIRKLFRWQSKVDLNQRP